MAGLQYPKQAKRACCCLYKWCQISLVSTGTSEQHPASHTAQSPPAVTLTGDYQKITINPDDLKDYVGPPPFSSDRIYDTTPPGVVMGLAWTSMGGNSLYVEAAGVEKGEGKGSLRTTGQLFLLCAPNHIVLRRLTGQGRSLLNVLQLFNSCHMSACHRVELLYCVWFRMGKAWCLLNGTALYAAVALCAVFLCEEYHGHPTQATSAAVYVTYGLMMQLCFHHSKALQQFLHVPPTTVSSDCDIITSRNYFYATNVGS